jgi:Mg2+/citrate symporter
METFLVILGIAVILLVVWTIVGKHLSGAITLTEVETVVKTDINKVETKIDPVVNTIETSVKSVIANTTNTANTANNIVK